jgi:hypothetical protein
MRLGEIRGNPDLFRKARDAKRHIHCHLPFGHLDIAHLMLHETGQLERQAVPTAR